MPKKNKVYGAKQEAVSSKPFKSIVIQGQLIDHDAGFECVVSLEDFKKRIAIPLTARENADKKEKGKAPTVRGFFATVKETSKGIQVERNLVKNVEGLKELFESTHYKKSRLLEVDPFGLGIDQVAGVLPPNNEFIPLQGGPFNKQLYLYDYLDQHAKAFQAKNHNPLAKQIVDIITSFSMGKGLKVAFVSPEIQEAWKAFVKRNDFDAFVRMDSDTITWAGEIMTHKTHFEDGYPRLVHIDPSTVWEIVTDPKDITREYYFHQQFPTQWQLVYKIGDISSEYIVNDVPANEVIFRKINTVPGEKRGRSDLFPILGWLKRFKDYYDAKITKAQIEQSWAIRKTVKGNGADVDAVFNDPSITQVPHPGSVIIENEAITTDYMRPDSVTDSGGDNIGEAIRSICATGVGLSPDYLGVHGSSGSNKATSITKAEPSDRKFEDRQMFFENYVREIIEWWLIEGKAKGFVPKTQVRESSLAALKKAIRERKFLLVIKEATALIGLSVVKEPIDENFEIIFPEISTVDRTTKLKDIAQSEQLKYISHARAAQMTAKELGITSYDFEAEMEARRLEAEERTLDPSYDGSTDIAAPPFKSKAGGVGAPAGGQKDAAAYQKAAK